MTTDGRDAGDRATVQSLERALDILEALASFNDGAGIVELSGRVSLHVSTVHRLLATLERRGYARQNPQTHRYSLGNRVLQLGRAVHDQSDLRAEARPYLQRLTDLSGETSNLMVLHQDEVMYIDQVQSPRLVRMFAEIGRRVPLHSTGGGKAILASMPAPERCGLLAARPLVAVTPHTINSIDRLEHALEEVRSKGYAVDDEEQEEGVRCVAGPVRDHGGKVVGALSLSGPTTRMTRERIEELGRLVARTCIEFSRSLGYEGNAVDA